MHSDQLAYFLSVVETGSINATAQNFFMSQQAINIQLKKLEEEIDAPLLNRSRKGITLTPQGQLFVPYAQEILQKQNEAVREIHRFSTQETNLFGTLSIFSASIFSETFLPNVIGNFIQLQPNTSIKIIDANAEELLPYLLNGYCELILLSACTEYIKENFIGKQYKNLRVLPLLDDTQVLCARPDHPLMQNKSINMDTTLAYSSQHKFRYSLYQILPIFIPELVFNESVCNSNNVEIHKKLILEGAAITYMPKLAYTYEFQKKGFAAVPVEHAKKITHCLLYLDNPESENYALLQYFVGFIQKQFQRRFSTYIQDETK